MQANPGIPALAFFLSQIIPGQEKCVWLINGESGTGKELIAGALHHNSSRKDGPFIKDMEWAAIRATLD
jgi:two-component system response regulator HydG